MSSEYEAWVPEGHFGNSGLALGTAVLRRGRSLRVVGTNPDLESDQASITILNSELDDVTSLFSFSMEPDMDYKAVMKHCFHVQWALLIG